MTHRWSPEYAAADAGRLARVLADTYVTNDPTTTGLGPIAGYVGRVTRTSADAPDVAADLVTLLESVPEVDTPDDQAADWYRDAAYLTGRIARLVPVDAADYLGRLQAAVTARTAEVPGV